MAIQNMAMGANGEELALLHAAQSGDELAFEALTRPRQRELHIHCYRMLGTLADADDALQETLLRAWRQLRGFEPRAPFRAWLYRIATNVCLTMLARRARRQEVAIADGAAASPGMNEPVHLQPYPDHLLDDAGALDQGPEAIAELREGVELAFIAAIQLLSPRQRATLILRDVVGYSAAEVGTMLATSVASVNSALQRARASVARGRAEGAITWSHASPGTTTEQALVRRLVEAWHVADISAIVNLLTEDALLTMPPQPLRLAGPPAIRDFLPMGRFGDGSIATGSCRFAPTGSLPWPRTPAVRIMARFRRMACSCWRCGARLSPRWCASKTTRYSRDSSCPNVTKSAE